MYAGTTTRAATTCHSATGSTSTLSCAATTRLRLHTLYVNLVVHREYSSPLSRLQRLLRLRRASGCLGTSRGSSRSSSRCSSSTTPPRACSSLTTSPPPRVRVPRHVARLVTRLVAMLVVDYSASRRLVIDYFDYAARPGASACRTARHAARRAARRRLLRLAARPGASARRAARRRLLCLRRASGCLGTSCGSSRHSSSTSTTPRIRVPRHVVRLVTRLVVDYSCPANSSCGHIGSNSAAPCVATTFLVATPAILRVCRVPP
jgi:hypothetical protein